MKPLVKRKVVWVDEQTFNSICVQLEFYNGCYIETKGKDAILVKPATATEGKIF